MMYLIIELLKQYLTHYGLFGVGLGMALESLGVPVISVILELSSGPLILSGKTSILAVIIVSDIGIVLGSIVSYLIGYYGFPLIKKIRKKKLYTKRELEFRKKLEKHGLKFIFLAQLVGPLRTWASYPAGALRLNFKKFVLYTALGGLVYSGLMVAISLGLASLLNGGFKLVEDLFRRYTVSSAIVTAAITFFILFILFLRGEKVSKTRELL